MTLRTLKDVNVTNKTVLVRVDLNVPMQGGMVTDMTRIERLKPTLQYLLKKKARIVLLSHFGRPEGKFMPDLSLSPLANALTPVLGKEVLFGVDCVGPAAHEAVAKLKPTEAILLENLRFHPEEEKGDANFARELAGLGEVFINDAFSCSHRAHASITGITRYLPSAAGRLMQQETEELGAIFSNAKEQPTVIVGGAKISTKLALLENLIGKVDSLIIGGAMANTFLLAEGHSIGKSLAEPAMKATAGRILEKARKKGCEIILPIDVVIARELKWQGNCAGSDVDKIPKDFMAVDIGYKTLEKFVEKIKTAKTVVWNGPIGAFETSPFDAGSVYLARVIAALTAEKKIRSIAGGGDTLAALTHAGLTDQFSYVSTAGGAFLEWLEGKTLPGVAALQQMPKAKKPKSNKKLTFAL